MKGPSPSIVIFGASGDLTWRKLVPALYNLYVKERLPQEFRIVGHARTEYTHEQFREHLHEGVEKFAEIDSGSWEQFAKNIYYVQGRYDEPGALQKLNDFVKEKEPANASRLYYLAVPPTVFAPIVNSLGKARMARDNDRWCRVVFEKPFGHDLESARELNAIAHNVLIDLYRARYGAGPLDDAMELQDQAPSPEDAAIAGERARTVTALLDQLSLEQRQVLELRLAGLTSREIGEVLGKHPNAIDQLQYRAVRRLRALTGTRGALLEGLR